MSVVLFNLETCLETKWKRYVSHTIILSSVFPCISWFKWWVVGNLLCRPLKSLSPPPTPSFEGTEPFHATCSAARYYWPWATLTTWVLTFNSFLAIHMPPVWHYDVSLHATTWQWSHWKTECFLPSFACFLPCLTHSRECGCSIRLDLLAWQVDMWDHPYALEKDCAERVNLKRSPMRNSQCVSNYSNLIHMQNQLCFLVSRCLYNFLLATCGQDICQYMSE